MIGAKLKALRVQNKYTITQLCELLEMNSNTYAKYEREERDVSTETLNKFADFYHVTTDYLLGRETGEPDTIDKLSMEFDLDALERRILENYIALPDDLRDDLMEFLQKSVQEVISEQNGGD